MAFVNEYVSKDDIEKYNLIVLREKYRKSLARISWTVDKERDCYLVWLGSGQEEFFEHQLFALNYKKNILVFTLKISLSGGDEGPRVGCWSFVNPPRFPEFLKGDEQEIIGLLKEALVEYHDFGVRSVYSKSDLTIKFDF